MGCAGYNELPYDLFFEIILQSLLKYLTFSCDKNSIDSSFVEIYRSQGVIYGMNCCFHEVFGELFIFRLRHMDFQIHPIHDFLAKYESIARIKFLFGLQAR